MGNLQINPGWDDKSHLKLIETAATELAGMGIITDDTLNEIKETVHEKLNGK